MSTRLSVLIAALGISSFAHPADLSSQDSDKERSQETVMAGSALGFGVSIAIVSHCSEGKASEIAIGAAHPDETASSGIILLDSRTGKISRVIAARAESVMYGEALAALSTDSTEDTAILCVAQRRRKSEEILVLVDGLNANSGNAQWETPVHVGTMKHMYPEGVWMVPVLRRTSEESVHGVYAAVCVRSSEDGFVLSILDSAGKKLVDQKPVAARALHSDVQPLHSVGDCDGDGVTDIAIISGGSLSVYSGRTAEQLSASNSSLAGDGQYISAVCGHADIDGDKIPDLAVACTSARAGVPSKLVLCSGKTGMVLLDTEVTQSAEGLGFAVVPIVDSTSDGVEELLVSTFAFTHNTVSTYDGKTLKPVGEMLLSDGDEPDAGRRLVKGACGGAGEAWDVIACRYSIRSGGSAAQGVIALSTGAKKIVWRVRRDQVMTRAAR